MPSATERAALPPTPGVTHEAVDDNPENPANWLSLQIVYDQVLAQLDAQNDRWESADARLRLILGLIGVVFAIASSFVSRGVTTVTGPAGNVAEPLYLEFGVGALLIAGLLMFAAASIIAIVAYRDQTFYRPPDPVTLRHEYLMKDPRVTKRDTVDAALFYYQQNQAALKSKLRAFEWALVLTTFASGLFGAAVIIQLMLITRRWS